MLSCDADVLRLLSVMSCHNPIKWNHLKWIHSGLCWDVSRISKFSDEHPAVCVPSLLYTTLWLWANLVHHFCDPCTNKLLVINSVLYHASCRTAVHCCVTSPNDEEHYTKPSPVWHVTEKEQAQQVQIRAAAFPFTRWTLGLLNTLQFELSHCSCVQVWNLLCKDWSGLNVMQH